MNSFYRLVISACLLSMTGCAAATVKATWQNPEYSGDNLRKILVLGISENDTYLRMFEDALARKLERAGMEAVPGYTLFPDSQRPARKTIASEISEKGFDTMIISRVTGRRIEEVVHPAGPSYWPYSYYEPPYYHHRWYDYYSRHYDIVHQPAYITQHEILTVQTNIYDARTEDLVWSAVSEVSLQGSADRLIFSFVDALVNKMREMRLF